MSNWSVCWCFYQGCNELWGKIISSISTISGHSTLITRLKALQFIQALRWPGYQHFLFFLQCSATCERGMSMRSVKCRSVDGRILNDTSCDVLSRPEDKKDCYMGSCPLVSIKTTSHVTTSHVTTSLVPETNTYKWKSSVWTQVRWIQFYSHCYITCIEEEIQTIFTFSILVFSNTFGERVQASWHWELA